MKIIERRNSLRRECFCALLGLIYLAPSTATAALIMNLRFADGSLSRQLTPSDVGTDIPINVWATVTGPGPEEEGYFFGYFRIVSGIQGVLPIHGNLTNGTLMAPFNATGSQVGTFVDLNSDTIRDVGSNNALAGTAYPKPRAAEMQTIGVPGETGVTTAIGREWHVATYMFHVDSLESFPGLTDQLILSIGFPTSNSVPRTNWREDGVNKSPTLPVGSPGQYLAGTSVSMSAVPEPSTLLLAAIGLLAIAAARLRR